MKKIPVIMLVAFCLAFTAMAEAAGGKKRTRSANRIGPYGSVFVGMTSYDGDNSQDEADLIDLITDEGIPATNVRSETEDSDFGYILAFGYRFHRYFAAELGLAQFGSLSSKAQADLDIPNDGQGPLPTTLELGFNAGGALISFIGILPFNDKFEAYARAGYLFASVEREFTSRVGGQGGVQGSAKGDDQQPVYGVGLNWNINQVYSVRAEYQVATDLGQENRTGTEDIKNLFLGLIVRF